MIKSFKNVTALVTGASSGIGKALARELAAQGAHLILVSRNAQRLEQEAEDLRIRFGVNVHIFPEDLERLEDRLELFAWTQKSGLTVDVLVNNAGVAHYGPFNEASFKDVSAMLDLNVQALTHLIFPKHCGQNARITAFAFSAYAREIHSLVSTKLQGSIGNGCSLAPRPRTSRGSHSENS